MRDYEQEIVEPMPNYPSPFTLHPPRSSPYEHSPEHEEAADMSFPTHSPTLTRASASSDQEPSINREQAGAIAALLRLVQPRWDQLATLEAVLDASRTRRDLANLTAGCIRIVQDATNRTPASLRYAAAWSRAAAAPTPRASVRLNESCTVAGHDGYPADNCAGCKVDQALEAAQAARHQFAHPPARYQEDQ